MANALNRTEAFRPSAFTAAIVRRDAFGPRRGFQALIAELDGRIVGYTSFATTYNTDIAGRELWMHDLYVIPRVRSRGVGRALVAAVAHEAVRRRLPRVGWGVRATNARAVRFYRGLGARIGQTRTAVLLERSLARLARRP